MPFTLFNLIDYFPKQLVKRGENHIESSHVIHYQYEDNMLRGKVKRSMKEEVVKVQVK